MKPLLLMSVLGLTAGASSVTTFQLVHRFDGGDARYEMHVLEAERAVVTLDRQTGDVKYIYHRPIDTPPSQFAVEVKHGASMGQVLPPARDK